MLSKIHHISNSFTSEFIQKNIQISTYKSSFLVYSKNEIKKILIDEIVFFSSENNSTFLVTINSRSYPISLSLDKLSLQIDENQFFRISRKQIINKSFISFIKESKVYLNNDQINSLNISNSRLKLFLNWFQK